MNSEITGRISRNLFNCEWVLRLLELDYGWNTPPPSSCCAMISSDAASSVDEIKFQIYSVHAQHIRCSPYVLLILELDIRSTPSPYVLIILELDTLYTLLSS